jgi:hypothetical protein
MPAKKNPAGDNDADADAKLNSIINSLATLTTSVQQQQQQLATITSRLDKVDLLTEQLGNIEDSLKFISSENVTIKSTLAANQAALSSVQGNSTNTRDRGAFELWSFSCHPRKRTTLSVLRKLCIARYFSLSSLVHYRKTLSPRFPAANNYLNEPMSYLPPSLARSNLSSADFSTEITGPSASV